MKSFNIYECLVDAQTQGNPHSEEAFKEMNNNREELVNLSSKLSRIHKALSGIDSEDLTTAEKEILQILSD